MRNILLSLIPFLFMIPCAHSQDLQNVQLVSVYDGDTFKIIIPGEPEIFGKNILVRVYGIDTPEIKSKSACERALAYKAKSVAETFLHSGAITLHNVKRDKYFRILADVTVGDKYLKDALLSERLAYAYYGKTKSKWCRLK